MEYISQTAFKDPKTFAKNVTVLRGGDKNEVQAIFANMRLLHGVIVGLS